MPGIQQKNTLSEQNLQQPLVPEQNINHQIRQIERENDAVERTIQKMSIQLSLHDQRQNQFYQQQQDYHRNVCTLQIFLIFFYFVSMQICRALDEDIDDILHTLILVSAVCNGIFQIAAQIYFNKKQKKILEQGTRIRSELEKMEKKIAANKRKVSALLEAGDELAQPVQL